MGHTVREKAKLLGRVRRIRGQLEALERALEEEKGCSEVLHQIAAARGAMNGLMVEVLEDHIEMHVANPASSNVERTKGADELIEVIRSYVK
jgi:DNA-binding FrmR family transcriptional regulator